MLNNYLKSEFNKNVFTLLSGATLAQLIPIAISPVLSRIYHVEDFGYLATLMSIVSPVVIIASLRYELSIILPKDDTEAINLLALSFLITAITSILCLIGVILFTNLNPNYNTILSKWVYFSPILVFSLGMYQCLNNWGNRLKKYKALTTYRITNSFINGTSSISLGIMKVGSAGLLAGALSGYLLGLLVLLLTLSKSIKENWKYVSLKEMISKAKEYKIFPIANSLQAISDVFQINGIIYFIGYFFSSVIVGWYSFAIRILLAPMNLIGSAIAQVFYQQASANFNNGLCLQSLVKKTIKKSIIIGLPVLLTLILFGPFLFKLVFGEEWAEAGVYAQILSPWIFLDFIRAPISQIPIVIKRQQQLLLFSLISNTLLVISMIYGGLIVKEIKHGFYLFSITQSIYIIFVICWIYKISKK